MKHLVQATNAEIYTANELVAGLKLALGFTQGEAERTVAWLVMQGYLPTITFQREDPPAGG